MNIQHFNWHKPLYSSQEAVDIYNCVFKKDKLRISIEDLINSNFVKKHGLSKTINNSKLLKKKSSISEDNSSTIERVSAIFDIEEAQVKSVV